MIQHKHELIGMAPDKCESCPQKTRNNEQDKRLEKLESSSLTKFQDIASLKRAIEDREKMNGVLHESDNKLEQKISDTEHSLEERVDKRIKEFDLRLLNFETKLDKIDQKLWGFLIALFVMVLGFIIQGS